MQVLVPQERPGQAVQRHAGQLQGSGHADRQPAAESADLLRPHRRVRQESGTVLHKHEKGDHSCGSLKPQVGRGPEEDSEGVRCCFTRLLQKHGLHQHASGRFREQPANLQPGPLRDCGSCDEDRAPANLLPRAPGRPGTVGNLHFLREEAQSSARHSVRDQK